MHKYTNTQMHKYTNTNSLSRAITFPSANTQMHKYKNTQMHKYTNANSPVKSNHFAKHKYTDAQIHKHKFPSTNTYMDKQISLQMQKLWYTDPQIHRWTNKDTQMHICTFAEMHRYTNPKKILCATRKPVARFPNPLAFGSEWFRVHGSEIRIRSVDARHPTMKKWKYSSQARVLSLALVPLSALRFVT